MPVPEARRVTAQIDPHSFEDVEVAIVRSQLGVAEAGAIWLTDADLNCSVFGSADAAPYRSP